ncbi:MAG TPA: hypothetical protein VNT26_06910, partial [Candidatus Sulfotelmatobacter sp.]|nr:hypothetical protein [Candidatus Sulfotelmatobacter sp.]
MVAQTIRFPAGADCAGANERVAMMSSNDSIYAQILRRLARAVYRYPKWFIYPQLLLALLCALYTAFGLKMDMNRGHLIGPRMKYQQIYLKFRQEFPGEDE